MPGLIDCHTHLCVVQASGEVETVLENLGASEGLKVLCAARHARETLEAGFTTVRDMGLGDNLALKEAIERGIIPGPRIVACGWLGMTGGQQERVVSEWQFGLPPRKENVGVDGPWEVRKEVRRLVGQGYDCIKTYASGGGYIRHPWDRFWSDQRNYTLDELEAIADEAHAAGRKVAIHALANREGVKNAIAAGADTIEHSVFLDEEDVEKMKDRGIFYVPTLSFLQVIWDTDDEKRMEYLRIKKEDAKRYLENHIESFRRAHQNGVRIALGSDVYRVLRQGDNAYELESMLKAGMPEVEVLVSATKTASEALGIDQLVGSVEEGKLADLLVVDPSPLTNISILRNRNHLKLIIKNGEIISQKFF
jgi:imidazolonepropionase-like amidohydrolase